MGQVVAFSHICDHTYVVYIKKSWQLAIVVFTVYEQII